MAYDLDWSINAACLGMPVKFFFEDYESNPEVAKRIDGLCMTCPIQYECLRRGVGMNEVGVWGGIYLEDGEISNTFNAHKTKNDWSNLWLNFTTQMQ